MGTINTGDIILISTDEIDVKLRVRKYYGKRIYYEVIKEIGTNWYSRNGYIQDDYLDGSKFSIRKT